MTVPQESSSPATLEKQGLTTQSRPLCGAAFIRAGLPSAELHLTFIRK